MKLHINLKCISRNLEVILGLCMKASVARSSGTVAAVHYGKEGQ
jgi:hypothetical protein